MSSIIATKWNNFYSFAKLYFSRHPVIGAYYIMCAGMTVEGLRRYWKRDKLMNTVSKYRRYYIVRRPDDLSARLVKRQKIGMDY